jgi:hypothetical protein
VCCENDKLGVGLRQGICIFRQEKFMQVSVFVPQYGVIEAITPAFRTFNTANEFLTVFGKKPIFQVEYVGLNEYVPANNGEYTIKTDRLLKDVTYTDLLIIPPAFGDTGAGDTGQCRSNTLFQNASSKWFQPRQFMYRCFFAGRNRFA